MPTYELRIYKLASQADLDFFKDEIYPRHLEGSLDKYGISLHGFWTNPEDDEPRLFALASYPEGANPAEVDQKYLASPELRKDLEGFDPSKIVGIESVPLTPCSGSPLQ